MATADKFGIHILYEPSERGSKAKEAKNADSYTSAAFDLVAIHGLRGDPFRTWTDTDTGVLWLKDLLPELFPNARIMTFGYDAAYKFFTEKIPLRRTAEKLLCDLADVRSMEEETKRPIILICHSLGGIVAKKALIISTADREEQIQRSVFAIISRTKIVNNVIRTLEEDSQILLDITDDFVKRRRPTHLVSFFEMEPTHISRLVGKRLIVEHRSAMLNVPEEVAIGQYCDHREIARFKSLHDRNFRSMLARIRKVVKDLHDKFYKEAESQSSSTEENRSSEGASTSWNNAPIPLEIPILPCKTFHGRTEAMSKLHQYFGETEKQMSRKVFALCGLGGSGKTQLALRYIFQNQSNYKTGVLFLNATSNTSLSSGFAQTHGLLGLKDAGDPVGSVKRWLSKAENSSWLMVLDNADDLDSVSLHQYFPAAPWGHIIITSRDQAALTLIADDGLDVGPLAKEDAVKVLLEKAAIQNPTPTELECAHELVGQLGELPLAIDHAGAFIRSRHKSLKYYLNLYLKQRDELLRLAPRAGQNEKAVLATWELDFKELEEDSSGAADLLLLFSFLDPSTISETLLHRGSSSRRRWSKNGEPIEVSAKQAGIDSGLECLIQNELAFDNAIDRLLSFSLISCKKENDGMRTFAVHPLVQHCAASRLSIQDSDKWRSQAILLTCHAFPTSQYLEPPDEKFLFSCKFLPHIARLLLEYERLSDHAEGRHLIRTKFLGTLLRASEIGPDSWKLESVTHARKLLEGLSDPYLNVLCVRREARNLLTIQGNVEAAQAVLESFIRSSAYNNQGLGYTPRYNAHRSNGIRSFATTLMNDRKLDEAKQELYKWTPIDPQRPSTLERIALRARDITLGRVLQFQGEYFEAISLYENLLKTSVDDENFESTVWRYTLTANLSELYSEVGRGVEGEKIVQEALSSLRRGDKDNRIRARRLRRALAENYISQNIYDKAIAILLDLKTYHDTVQKKTNYESNIGRLRMLVALARVYHLQRKWADAFTTWGCALEMAEKVQLSNGYYRGLLRYSRSQALRMTEIEEKTEKSAALELIEEAREEMATEKLPERMYWITGLNQNWEDHINNYLGLRRVPGRVDQGGLVELG